MYPNVTSFFHDATNTITHVVADPDSGYCAVIDPVLDFDAASGRTSTQSADLIVNFIEAKNLSLQWILETHAHADHLTAAPYFKKSLGGAIGIGNHITTIQGVFKEIFNLQDLISDGRHFDRLFRNGETFHIGEIIVTVMHTPGHTPACITYVAGDAAFVGDTLFMPDYGTARCDFPGGDAATLYESIRKIFLLPEDTRLFMCHDYKAPNRKEFAWESTVAEQREKNIHVHRGVSRDEFVAFRAERDSTLGMPKLILQSIQVNIRAGEFPSAEANHVSYLKIPLNRL